MSILINSQRPFREAYATQMRQRLDAVTSFLSWSTSIIAATPLPDRDGCRIVMKRASQARQDEAIFVIDVLTSADDPQLRSPPPMPEGVIHAEVHDGILTADLAANLRLVKKACGSLSHPVARQIMVFEMPVGGARMTKAVLEARLVKRGFNPTEASTTVMALLGDRSLQVDFREPISAGSLIWRRRKDQKSNHDALPWDQVLAYCSPV